MSPHTPAKRHTCLFLFSRVLSYSLGPSLLVPSVSCLSPEDVPSSRLSICPLTQKYERKDISPLDGVKLWCQWLVIKYVKCEETHKGSSMQTVMCSCGSPGWGWLALCAQSYLVGFVARVQVSSVQLWICNSVKLFKNYILHLLFQS